MNIHDFGGTVADIPPEAQVEWPRTIDDEITEVIVAMQPEPYLAGLARREPPKSVPVYGERDPKVTLPMSHGTAADTLAQLEADVIPDEQWQRFMASPRQRRLISRLGRIARS